MSRIKELTDLTYSRTDLSCLSFFNSSRIIQDVLFKWNYSLISWLRRSHISIFRRPTLKSFLVLVLYQSLTSLVRYITMRSTCSATLIFTTLKYCSMSHKKFSSFLELLTPPKDFSLGTVGLDVLTPIGVFVTGHLRMAMVSSATSNHSLDSSTREMCKLFALSAFSITSFK